MKISNVVQIRAEDFSPEYSTLTSQLGNIINPFMLDVFEAVNGRIGFDNLEFRLIQFDITVDEKGVPNQSPFRVNTGKDRVLGTQVISARAYSSGVFPSSAPFISFIPEGAGIIRVENICGLFPNVKFNIICIIY